MIGEFEIWKDIPGYKGYYQASTFGRIKGLKRTCVSKKDLRLVPEKILAQKFDKYGYLCLHLSKNNIRQYVTVHRLVALTFHPNLYDKPEVNHKDCVKSNNYYLNLEWSTTSENQVHAVENNLINYNPVKKKIIQMNIEGDELKIWDAIEYAANFYKINPENISRVCSGKRVSAAGYKWRFANV